MVCVLVVCLFTRFGVFPTRFFFVYVLLGGLYCFIRHCAVLLLFVLRVCVVVLMCVCARWLFVLVLFMCLCVVDAVVSELCFAYCVRVFVFQLCCLYYYDVCVNAAIDCCLVCVSVCFLVLFVFFVWGGVGVCFCCLCMFVCCICF